MRSADIWRSRAKGEHRSMTKGMAFRPSIRLSESERLLAAGGALENLDLPGETLMTAIQSDSLVFFGATGDLAYKQIFPALQALVKHGHLKVPVIGVAKAGWNLAQLRARAQDSLEKHGGIDPAAFEKLGGLLRYVDGDYTDP